MLCWSGLQEARPSLVRHRTTPLQPWATLRPVAPNALALVPSPAFAPVNQLLHSGPNRSLSGSSLPFYHVPHGRSVLALYSPHLARYLSFYLGFRLAPYSQSP